MSHALSTSTDWPLRALARDMIESLFELMAFTYGNRFADQWAGVDTEGMKQHWAAKLGDMSQQELCRGIDGLCTRDWPPTLPEFMKLCRPALDPAVAYQEAVVQGAKRNRGEPDVWSCPAVFWAWKRIPEHDFIHLPYTVLKARWEAAFAEALAAELQLSVPAQAPALPPPGKASIPVAQARQLLSKLIKGTKAGYSEHSADPLRWARAIVERDERGEFVTLTQLHNAKAVLGLP